MEYGNWNNNQYQGRYTGELQNSDYEKATIKKVRKSFSRIGLIYITFLGVSYLSQLAVTLILSQLAMTETINLDIYMLLTMLSMYPLAVPLTGFLMKFVPSTGEIGREQWGIGKISAFFIFSMGVLYIGNLIGTVLMTAVGVLKEEPIANDVQEMILSMEPWLILVVAVIIAPIMEELVFRKFLLDRIAGFGHWTAMTVSGVIFGIAHGNFYQFWYI